MNLSDSARSQLALSVDLRDAVVLLVDDLPREAEELLIALTESGLKVLVADSGPAAKQKLMREPVDLVVVDLKRADMDSFELCRQLKVPPPTRLIPVLFVSARTDVDAKIRAFRVGACDYLDDAIDFSELLVRIEYHIRGGRKQRPEGAAKSAAAQIYMGSRRTWGLRRSYWFPVEWTVALLRRWLVPKMRSLRFCTSLMPSGPRSASEKRLTTLRIIMALKSGLISRSSILLRSAARH